MMVGREVRELLGGVGGQAQSHKNTELSDGQCIWPPGRATAPRDSMNCNLGVLWRYSGDVVTSMTS